MMMMVRRRNNFTSSFPSSASSSVAFIVVVILTAALITTTPAGVGATAATATSAVTTLTVDNFETVTEGKSVFIKFFAPWCGHCRAMADDWEKLGEEWNDHNVGLIAQVDCTSDDGQPICEDFDVQNFPTIVWGDPMSAETYDGERTYEEMSKFAKEYLSKPICSFFHPTNCNEEEQQIIKELESKTTDELEDIVTTAEKLVVEEEVLFDEQVTKIQHQYDMLVEEFNTKLDEIKEQHNYKYVEQLLTIRQMNEEEGDNEEGETAGDEDGAEL